jgi:hypothetical protein
MAHYIPKNIQRRGDKYSRVVVFNPSRTNKQGNRVKALHSLLAKAQEKDESLHLQAGAS